MEKLSSLEISEKIAALDARSDELYEDYDAISTEVVSGVEGAGEKALKINQDLERLAVERTIHKNALTRARQAEADTKAKAEADRRQVHRERARTEAMALVECADRVDGLVDDLVSAMSDMQDRWRAVHDELRAACEPSNFTNTGRQSLTPHVIGRLSLFVQGVTFDKTERRAGHFARAGWSDLIGGSDA